MGTRGVPMVERVLGLATNPEWQWLIFSWDSLTLDFHLVERPW